MFAPSAASPPSTWLCSASLTKQSKIKKPVDYSTGFFYAKIRKETTPYFFSRRAPTVRAMAIAVTLLEGNSIACRP